MPFPCPISFSKASCIRVRLGERVRERVGIQMEEDMLHSDMLYSALIGSGDYFDHPPQAVEFGEGRKRRQRKKKANGEEGGEGKKQRRLSDEQVKLLEMNFSEEQMLESDKKMHLAAQLGLDPKQVAMWFQNRRARWKKKQLEEEFVKMKAAYDGIVVHKCQLENEVLSLKERLSQAEEQLKKLSSGPSGASGGMGSGGGGSPCSSFPTTTQPTFLGELGVEGEVDLMYMPEYYFDDYMMDWTNI